MVSGRVLTSMAAVYRLTGISENYRTLGLLDLLDVPLPPPSGPVGIITRRVGASVPALDDLAEVQRTAGSTLALPRA